MPFAAANEYCDWSLAGGQFKKKNMDCNIAMIKFAHHIAAKYGIVQPLVNVSCTGIKRHVRDTFASTVL